MMPSMPEYKVQTGLAVASGLLLTAAFPNVELGWLAWGFGFVVGIMPNLGIPLPRAIGSASEARHVLVQMAGGENH